MWSRLAVSLVAVAALATAGCELLSGVSSTSLFRPGRRETSWQKTMREHPGIQFRDPVLTPEDPLPTLVKRRLRPRHPDRFGTRFHFDELLADRAEAQGPPVADAVQLAVSLQWLEEEYGIPPEVELHRGLLCSNSGVDLNQVMLRGWYRGIEVPSMALISLDRDRIIGALVHLSSVSEVEGSSRPIVTVEQAREATRMWLQGDGLTPSQIEDRLWSVKQCQLLYQADPMPSPDGTELLLPVWSCATDVFVHGYEGTAFRPPRTDP